MIDVSREGRIALVRYDRGAKANALSRRAMEMLSDVARTLREDDAVSVVVLTGTPTRFSAGVDLGDEGIWQPSAGEVERRRSMAVGGEMCAHWAALPQVVIAAIEGPAVGGGGILSMAADFRVMANDGFIAFPEIKLGMSFGWGGLAALTSLVGPTTAKRLLFTGRRVAAAEALAMGLCDEVAAKGEAVAAAMAMAAEIAECPPLALRMTKRCIDGRFRSNWAADFEDDQSLLPRMVAEA